MLVQLMKRKDKFSTKWGAGDQPPHWQRFLIFFHVGDQLSKICRYFVSNAYFFYAFNIMRISIVQNLNC